MIKSTRTTLKFTNAGKLAKLHDFIDEYQLTVSKFVDILWFLDTIDTKPAKNITSQVDTWLSARAVQAAAKQASGIVRGTRKKQRQREWVHAQLISKGYYKKARKLKKKIDSVKISKPNINNVEPELDSRFVSQHWDTTTAYDGFITIASLGNKLKLSLPVKKTKHFNELCRLGGIIKAGVRLSKSKITFMFDLPDAEPKTAGTILGLDVGMLNVYSTSDGQRSMPCKHGHTLSTISKKLARKRRGSKAFIKAQQHRKNYINFVSNKINLNNVKLLKIENIRNLRLGNKTSRYLNHFTYTEIFNKLESLCATNGVQIERVNPTYTSQRCSKCGWVRSRNRKGKLFKCVLCKFELDADLNAALNIAASLAPIGRKERLLHKNKKGFYWNAMRSEPIVSTT